jgi:hypothetical protein
MMYFTMSRKFTRKPFVETGFFVVCGQPFHRWPLCPILVTTSRHMKHNGCPDVWVLHCCSVKESSQLMIKGHLYIQRRPLSRILEKPHQNRYRRRETKKFAAELECDPHEMNVLAFFKPFRQYQRHSISMAGVIDLSL